jgi:hypothetical protein
MYYRTNRRLAATAAGILALLAAASASTAGPMVSDTLAPVIVAPPPFASPITSSMPFNGTNNSLLSTVASPAITTPDPLASVFAELQAAMSVVPGLYGMTANPGYDWASAYDFGTAPLMLESALDGSPMRMPGSVYKASDPSMKLTSWSQVFNVARIGEFDVPLRSDPAERTNIILSAQAVDGVTLLPGQTFSFNDVVGERTAERGYQDGWMFDNGKLIRGSGGGICLVATGLYNVALRAGLDVVERHPHSGMVHYAAPGCDAAVVYGDEDLRFRNTTSGPLFIRALQRERAVSVVFFGAPPPPGYQVVLKQTHFAWLAPPAQQTVADETLQPGQTIVDQSARPGFEVTLQRIILQNGRVLRKETVASDRHVPLAKVVRVGPSDEERVDSFLSSLVNGTFGT